MDLDHLEAIIWSQARNLASSDRLTRTTAMEAVRVAARAYAEHEAGPIVAARRAVLEEVPA